MVSLFVGEDLERHHARAGRVADDLDVAASRQRVGPGSTNFDRSYVWLPCAAIELASQNVSPPGVGARSVAREVDLVTTGEPAPTRGRVGRVALEVGVGGVEPVGDRRDGDARAIGVRVRRPTALIVNRASGSSCGVAEVPHRFDANAAGGPCARVANWSLHGRRCRTGYHLVGHDLGDSRVTGQRLGSRGRAAANRCGSSTVIPTGRSANWPSPPT